MSDSKNGNNIPPEYWKSIKEYEGNSLIVKIKHDEFIEGVTDKFDLNDLSGISRRKFLALVAASAAFTASACSDYRDKGEIIPYNKRPEEILPGKANFYASTCNGCSQACGILIKTREGRPIKIDGNPEHPINQGKICAKGQANILNLYDPARLRHPLKNKRKSGWNTVDENIMDELKYAVENQKEIAIVAGKVNSPAQAKLLNDFIDKYPTTKVYSYELFNDDLKRNAWKKSFGTEEMPSIKWDKAKIILSLEGDFLGREGNTVENTRLFASRKDIMTGDDFSRLYVVESGMSLTGMNADYRLRLRPDAQFEFVMSLLNEIIKSGNLKISLDSNVVSKVSKYNLENFAEKNSLPLAKLKKLVADLLANQGQSIIYAGNTLSEDVHIVVNLLNEVLGNKSIYDFENSFVPSAFITNKNDWDALVERMNNQQVSLVIHFDTNPFYHFPNDLKYKDALKKIRTVVTLCESENETSDLSNFVLPLNHDFESWGDYRQRKNTISLQQPVIASIFDSRQKEAILLTWLNGSPDAYSEQSYHAFLKENFKTQVYDRLSPTADFNSFWYAALLDGIVNLKEPASAGPAFNQNVFENIVENNSSSGFIVSLEQSYFIGDGKFANNGWLQEIPHPVTKIAWDNFTAVSPATAKALSVEMGEQIEVDINGRKLILPVIVQPGLAEKVVSIELGYGRTTIGEVGAKVGVNANLLQSKEYIISPWIYTGAKVQKADGAHDFASTQEHHALDDTKLKDFHLQRKIIRDVTLDEYKKNPSIVKKDDAEIFSITGEHKYEGNKWAMAIDLNKCTSCGICVASCNVENNIPVVGKTELAKGREMHWMRIDRYYSGSPEEPSVSGQPMLCQHCDNAPCENVCPVNATNHSPDGLNQMVYNRCVGTRYCSNNCPYKVRRYNFFNFRDNFANAYYENELTYLVNNPEVTVRSRGVMEKCTFCVQKIMDARADAIKENREIRDGEIVTACQQACPSNAIVFGNANDPESVVSKYREHNLGYSVLDYLNVKPNVTYLAKLRNIDSEED
ncbi:MAG: TAT-variant-translocated molybdopterin oxidoreductase [bacterium]